MFTQIILFGIVLSSMFLSVWFSSFLLKEILELISAETMIAKKEYVLVD